MRISLTLILISLSISVHSDSPPPKRNFDSSVDCKSDRDCFQIIGEIDNKPPLGSLGAYKCLIENGSGRCKFVVKPGELCATYNDCASYHYLKSTNSTSEDNLLQLCSSDFCTLESSCGGAWSVSWSPVLASTSKAPTCCGGITKNQDILCPLRGVENVDVCMTGTACGGSQSSPMGLQASPNDRGKCEDQSDHYQLWIGIILVLLGGSLLNFGLNLQKYALNRHTKATQEANGMIETVQRAKSPNRVSTEVTYQQSAPTDIKFANLPERSSPTTEGASNRNSDGFNSGAPTIIDPKLAGRRVNSETSMSAENPHITRTFSHVSVAASAVIEGALTARDKFKLLMKKWRASVLSPLWLIGLIIYIVASFLNFVALQFAPQSLVGPLGSVALITNIILAPLMNKEKLGKSDFVGISLIIGGCVLVVFFSGIVQHDYRLCVLYALFSQPPTIAFLTIIAAIILSLFTYIKIVEKNLDQSIVKISRDNELHNVTGSSNPPNSAFLNAQHLSSEDLSIGERRPSHRRNLSYVSSRKTKKRSCRLMDPDSSIFDPIVPTTKPILADSSHYKYMLPLAYAGMGSLMATLTTLFAKTLINLLTLSFQGDNQFNSWLSWVILIFVVFTAFSQVYWITLGLRRYDALLQVPVFYVIWTLFDIVGGGVYFNEFQDFTSLKYGMFILGVAIIFSGVAVLGRRMARTNL